MSTGLIGIGQRLLAVRTKLGYPQSKMAARLGIADKSYKNYELEKRELPLSIAVKFCTEFEENLGWLVSGIPSPDISSAAEISADVVKAVFDYQRQNNKTYSPDDIAKYVRYLVNQVLTNGSSPAEEVEQFFSAIG